VPGPGTMTGKKGPSRRGTEVAAQARPYKKG
jgi:hypothetical protein